MAGGFGIPKDYPGKVTAYVLFTCIAAAMGGLIFGYDIGISGNPLTSAGLFIFFLFWFVRRNFQFYLIWSHDLFA